MDALRQQSTSHSSCNNDGKNSYNSRWHAYIGLTTVSLIYGGWVVVAKAAMDQHMLPPLLVAFYRCLFGSVLMFSAQALLGLQNGALHNECLKWHILFRRHALRFIMLGFLQAGNIGGAILAVNKLSALTVAIFQPLIPICAGVAAAFLNLEEFSICQAVGLFVAACGGVSVVALADHGAGGSSGVLPEDWNAWAQGGPCLALNILSLALYFVLQKRLCSSCPPILVAGSSFSIALVPISAALMCTISDNSHWWPFNTAPPRYVICYAVFLATAFNYSVLAWATRETSPTTAAAFMSLQPLFAALLSWLFYGSLPTLGQAFGGVLITAGLLLFVCSFSSEANADSEHRAGRAILEHHS